MPIMQPIIITVIFARVKTTQKRAQFVTRKFKNNKRVYSQMWRGILSTRPPLETFFGMKIFSNMSQPHA